MCLTHAIELLMHNIGTEVPVSLNELLAVHESYHKKAFPFTGSYKQLLRQQHNIPFTEYDVILMYRVLFYLYNYLNSTPVTPEQLHSTITPCILSMLSIMFARHISPVLCALRTFILSTTHSTFLSSIYQNKDTFVNLLHESSVSGICDSAAKLLRGVFQDTLYDKYIKFYCGRPKSFACCPIMSTSFIDQAFMQFISTSSPFLLDILTDDCCCSDRSMVHALSIAKERNSFQYLDKTKFYIPDISCGTSFGPPVSCYSDQSRPGPVRLTWLPITRTVMGKDDSLYPITKEPVPCTCCNSNREPTANSPNYSCTLNITARVTQVIMDFLTEFYKNHKNSNKKPNNLAFLKYLETIDDKNLCFCIKRDIISAIQLDMLYDLDRLLQTSKSMTYSSQSTREEFTKIAALFSMLYSDILTIECRSTGQYAKLSALHVRNIDKSPKSYGKPGRPKSTNLRNSVDNSMSDDCWNPRSSNKIRRKRIYKAYTKEFYTNNLSLELFNRECRSFKDLDAQGVSRSSAIYQIMSAVRLQDKKETQSSISKERRNSLSHLRTHYGVDGCEGDSLIYILQIMTSSMCSLASPPPTTHPFYFSIKQLYKCILLNNAASPWVLKLVDQIRTKDIQIVRHRVLSEERLSIYECSRRCTCPLSCMRRCVQFGKRYRLQIFRQRYGYWGLRTLDYIPKGAPICEYTGDLISENLAERRGAIADMQRCSYLYDIVCVLKYCLPFSEGIINKEARSASSGGMRLGISNHAIRSAYLSQEKIEIDDAGNHSASDLEASTIYVIDATRAGNEGRYANHRTKENITAKLVIWDDEPTSSHFAQPHLYFFATKDIKPMEELFLNYMYKDSADGLIKLKYPWAFDNDTAVDT